MNANLHEPIAQSQVTAKPGRLRKGEVVTIVGLHAVCLVFAWSTFSLEVLVLTLCLLYLTAGLGWSVGFHRCLIHGAFDCHQWARNFLCYLGVLSGLGGPLSSHRIHNIRDYYQNLEDDGDIQGYRSGFFKSYYLLLVKREAPADVAPVPQDQLDDRCLNFLENTQIYQQLLLALVLYLVGGWPYVVWGVFVRITFTIDMFAITNYFTHHSDYGYQSYRVNNAAHDGRNKILLGYTMVGEGWHNNHHAYPNSSRMGIKPWEFDLGYLCIRALRAAGLAWNVKTADSLPLRKDAEVL